MYPTCIPLGSDIGICDDIILHSLEVLFDEGYIILPYNNRICEMNIYWKMPKYIGDDELELKQGVSINRYVDKKYHSITFVDSGKVTSFYVENTASVWSDNIEDCDPYFKTYVNETLGVNIM